MAGDGKTNYVRIGFFTIAGILAIAGTLLYVGAKGGGENIIYAETYCDASVAGLSEGCSVNLRGVKVGTVARISFIGAEYAEDANLPREDAKKVYILLALDSTRLKMGAAADLEADALLSMLVSRGLHAEVAPAGLTGVSRINLDFPQFPPAKKLPGWTPRHTCIPPIPSTIQSLSESATALLYRLNKSDIGRALDDATATAESLRSAAASVDSILSAHRAEIDESVANIAAATESLRKFADDLAANPSQLLFSSHPDPLPETAPRN